MYLQKNQLPAKLSRFAVYRFKKRCENYYIKDDQIWSTGPGGDRVVVPEDQLQTTLKLEYEDPKTMSNGQQSFFNTIHSKYEGITFNQVRDFLQSQKTYQLHKPPKRDKIIKPVIEKSPGKYVQLDTINLDEYAFPNNNYKYALTVIDVFSKYAWVIPQKSLKASETVESFKKILKDLPELRTIQTDNGTEFQAEFAKLIREKGYRHNLSQSHTPQAQGQIERFNKTIKGMIHQYQTMYNTKIWVPAIDSLVLNYNNRIHSTTKQKPSDLFKGIIGEPGVADAYRTIVEANLKKVKAETGKLKAGDKVRILKSAMSKEVRKAQNSGIGKGAKSYIKQWSDGVYEISGVSRVNTTGINKTITLYKIEVDDTIRKFRRDQLQPVSSVEDPQLDKRDLEKYSIDFMKFGRNG